MKLGKAEKRDKAISKKKHGQRISGRSIFTIARTITGEGQGQSKKSKKKKGSK